MRRLVPILTILLLAGSGSPLAAQAGQAGSASQRVALVIGNSNYDAGPLLNPGNDARAMAKALRETGFEVMEYIDLQDQADMKKAIREFGRKIQNGGVGLFYYAGHGIQVNGKNYLIPTKAQIYAEEEVEYESVDVGFVMAQMEIARNRMNIIILDACRNNPFARSWRSAASGLAFINAPTGTLIAYSTAPGSVASDGTGANGLYTEMLLKQIRRKGLKIEDVFKNVRSEVLERSNRMQTPWESSSLVGDFYFRRPDALATGTGTETVTAPGPASDAQAETDVRPTERFEVFDRVEWRKGSDGRYFLFRNGADVSSNTAGTTVGDDVLVFDRTAGRSYVLKGFSNLKSKEAQQAVEIVSDANAFWKVNDEKWYWFYLEGTDVTLQTKNAYYGDNLVIFHPGSGRYFLMKDFKNAEPGRLHPAQSVFTPNNTLWWADEKYYYLYLDGEQIAARTYSNWKGNDLIVQDEESASSFLLKDYYHHSDRVLRPAEVLNAPGLITCSNQQGVYFLFRDGKPYIMGGPAAYSGQDLLVFDTNFYQTIVFEDFLASPDYARIAGRVIYSRSGAVWRRQDNTYYLYIKGELQAGDMVRASSSLSGNDLEVLQASTGITWILPDYAIRQDNILRPAEIKQ